MGVAESTGDVKVVTHVGLKLGVAGLVEVDLKLAGGWVYGEVLYAFGEEADWEAVRFEGVVN